MESPLNGIILIDKTVDTNSFNVIAGMRTLCGMKRIGHCGTLDPFASGLLPVAIGRATGAVQFLTALDKEYTVDIVFGERRNTMDREGEIIARGTVDFRDAADFTEQLKIAVASLTGRQKQVPPMFSAVKVAGKPLYYYARKGEEVERKARDITIYSATVRACSFEGGAKPTASVRIRCSKGTYIRTWVDALGEKLGIHAYACELRRSGVGSFTDATQWHRMDDLFDVFNALDRDTAAMRTYLFEHALIPTVAALPDWPRLELSKREVLNLLRGCRLEYSVKSLTEVLSDADDPNIRVLLVYRNILCAVTKPLNDILHTSHFEGTITDNTVLIPTERILFGEEDLKAAERNA